MVTPLLLAAGTLMAVMWPEGTCWHLQDLLLPEAALCPTKSGLSHKRRI